MWGVTHVWKDLDATVNGRLVAASEGERAVFAAGVAERLHQAHEALPAAVRREYTLGLIARHAPTLRRARFGLAHTTTAHLHPALRVPLSRRDDLT